MNFLNAEISLYYFLDFSMSWISHLQAASVFIFDKTRPVTIRKEGVCGEEEHVSAFVMMR